MTQPDGEPSYPPPPGQTYPSPYAPPPPFGEPQYGQPQYGQPQYGQPQYGQPQYGQPPQGWARPPRRLSPPATGWALVGTGALTVLAAVLPWASVGSISVDGTNGDGVLTLLFGLVIAAMGLVIGLGNGLLWTSIVALVCAALTALTAAVDAAHISTISSRFDGLDLNVSVGIGLWLTLIGGLVSLAAALLALLQRPVTGR